MFNIFIFLEGQINDILVCTLGQVLSLIIRIMCPVTCSAYSASVK